LAYDRKTQQDFCLESFPSTVSLTKNISEKKIFNKSFCNAVGIAEDLRIHIIENLCGKS